jgi:CubicO group peptidase (beta-lactamase class C family)
MTKPLYETGLHALTEHPSTILNYTGADPQVGPRRRRDFRRSSTRASCGSRIWSVRAATKSGPLLPLFRSTSVPSRSSSFPSRHISSTWNFLFQGYEFASARDWARLGNLYLQDGLWQGDRILPEAFVKFVSEVAPAWAADGQPIYGGLFWVNGDGALPLPWNSYYLNGAGNQYTIVIPSHELVVVRLGHYRGAEVGGESLKTALSMLMQAVPSKR